MPYVRSAESRELADFDLIDAGYGEGFPSYPAFNRTILHMPAPTGDWPLIRPSGPEPESLGFFGNLSDNERSLMMVGGAALGVFLLMRSKRGGRRR